MTLILTMINKFGVWQSSDHRLSDPKSHKRLGDRSIKHVALRCSDGAAQIAYTGAGEVGGVTLSDWIKETCRGETRTVIQTVSFLKENATRDLGRELFRLGMLHVFCIGAFINENPWAIEVNNCDASSTPQSIKLVDHFKIAAERVGDLGAVGAGGEGAAALSEEDMKKLRLLAARKPRSQKDFQGLLAAVHWRAAARPEGKSVSAECLTTYMPPQGEPMDCKFQGADRFSRRASREIVVAPTLMLGIDLTEMLRLGFQALDEMDAGREPYRPGAIEMAGKEAVTPRNRLRKH